MHKADEDEAEGRNRKERMIRVTAVTAATVLQIPDRYRKNCHSRHNCHRGGTDAEKRTDIV